MVLCRDEHAISNSFTGAGYCSSRGLSVLDGECHVTNECEIGFFKFADDINLAIRFDSAQALHGDEDTGGNQ